MEPYEGREPYIFISYAHEDAERAAPFRDALSADYRVWYDKGIQAGDEWLKTLEEKVTNCEVFCPLFSQAFHDSYYCFRETSYACWQDKKIVPLYLEEVGESLRLLFRLLKSLQHLRLYRFDSAAQFVEYLKREQAFAPCKVPEWNKIGQIQWRLSADGVLTITKNEDLSEEHNFGSIPSYQRDPIHGSAAPWAPYREKIVSVEITDDIDAIGNHAFRDCKSLTKVLISDSVTEIGNEAFRDCKSLMDVRISDNVTKIGDYAFMGCDSLRTMRIPDSVTKIGTGTFEYCGNLINVHIPDSVNIIGDRAFKDCDKLPKVYIPDSVTEIGERSFMYCSNLTNVHIPDSVTSIGDWAFAYCSNLKRVEIPTGVKVGNYAFTYPRNAPNGDKT